MIPAKTASIALRNTIHTIVNLTPMRVLGMPYDFGILEGGLVLYHLRFQISLIEKAETLDGVMPCAGLTD